MGGTSIGTLHKNIATGVNGGRCAVPPSPPAGVAWFSTGHPNSLNFLMGDGSVQVCSDSVDLTNVLIPALTAAAGDEFSGF